MADEDTVLNAWMGAIAAHGWRDATPAAATVLAGSTVDDISAVLPDRWSALGAFGRRLDRAALAEAASDRDASVRDRLFALIMARFDAAEDQKAAVRLVAEAARRDPVLAAYLLASLSLSTARLARAAGVPTGGLFGPLRVEALAALIARASQSWIDDADPDLATTMKALDTALERAERWAGKLPG